MQFISNCGYKGDLLQGIKLSIDGGARAGYIHGEIADRLVREGKTDEIAGAIELIHRNGLPAGIGAHSLETVKACVQLGLKPDFWVKTLHSSGYWSAQHPVQHDNTWCTSPSETIEVMRSLEQPWIAFKVLAAGAIHPKDGFPFAFQNGAYFVCVGMYDFQIVEDANIIHDVLSSVVKRKRFWQG